jgi:hypothetical protein
MKQITGSFKNPDGSPVAKGKVYFTLTVPTTVGSAQLTTDVPVVFQLDSNGTLPVNAQLWFSDEMSQLILYSVSVLAAGGGLVYGPEYYLLIGPGPLNVSTLVPSLMLFA